MTKLDQLMLLMVRFYRETDTWDQHCTNAEITQLADEIENDLRVVWAIRKGLILVVQELVFQTFQGHSA